jgi:hypothetical protein
MALIQCGSSVDKALVAFKELVQLLSDRPWTIFIIFTLVFGYGYYDQNKELHDLNLEVGGLRSEMKNMNEIIKLKVELAARECPIEE